MSNTPSTPKTSPFGEVRKFPASYGQFPYLIIRMYYGVYMQIPIQLSHEQINTQLDLGGVAPSVILQFDDEKKFTGASLSLCKCSGSFGLVTQSKNLLILPFDEHFPIGQLTHYKLN